MEPKTNEEQVEVIGNFLQIGEYQDAVGYLARIKEEAVAEAIENLKRVKQPDNGLPLFFIFQDILSYAPDGEIATLAKQGLEALTPPTN